ncbi:hypothetical protein F4818DRAFT_323431 [Hypoxylon cercidicola]|nr:hypothetical protein F4818DRAFT_323431 [Hypoxylon cercidicola]
MRGIMGKLGYDVCPSNWLLRSHGNASVIVIMMRLEAAPKITQERWLWFLGSLSALRQDSYNPMFVLLLVCLFFLFTKDFSCTKGTPNAASQPYIASAIANARLHLEARGSSLSQKLYRHVSFRSGRFEAKRGHMHPTCTRLVLMKRHMTCLRDTSFQPLASSFYFRGGGDSP